MINHNRKGFLCPIFTLIVFCSLLVAPTFAEELPPPGKPLTLEQCTQIALKYHPSLRANQAFVEASKARVEQALASYYPQVNLNGSYDTATNNFIPIGGTVAVSRSAHNWTFFDIFTSGLSLNQNLYDFGRTSNTVKINRENVKAAEEDYFTTKQTVVLNVQQAYFGVLQNIRLVKVAEDTINQVKQHLEQARGFYQAGTRSKIDVTKAEVDLANAELALITVRNNYQVARVTLNNAMGLKESLAFAIEDSLGFKPRPIAMEEILKLAYEKRPEILQLQARQRAQDATIKLAQSSYYPVLSGNANALYRGEDVNDLYWDMSFGVTVSIPLFSGYSTPNQIAEARANMRNLLAQEENLKLSIRLEAEQAYLNLQQAAESIRVSEKALTQAQENYDLASGRYQVGVGSPLEITDAEVSLAQARANNIQGLYNYKIAEAQIDKAMGLHR